MSKLIKAPSVDFVPDTLRAKIKGEKNTPTLWCMHVQKGATKEEIKEFLEWQEKVSAGLSKLNKLVEISRRKKYKTRSEARKENDQECLNFYKELNITYKIFNANLDKLTHAHQNGKIQWYFAMPPSKI